MSAAVANVTSTGSHGGGFAGIGVVNNGAFGVSQMDTAEFNGFSRAFGGPGSPDLNDNGHKVLRIGDIYLCPIHGPNPIISGSNVWRDNGHAIARLGDHMACGAVITAPTSPEWSST